MRNVVITLTSSCLVFAVTFLVQPNSAQAAGFGVGGKVSSLGVGGEVVAGLTDFLNLRAGVQGIAWDYDDTYSGIEYEGELELFSGLFLVDLFPAKNNFRISAGFALNQNELTVTGVPTNGTYEINGIRYPSNLVGTLSGAVDFDSFAPYAGLGYGGHFGDSENWGFFMDIGILFQGSPQVSYTASGPIANDPFFQANLEAERKQLEEDIDEYEYYPVLSMGVFYRF